MSLSTRNYSKESRSSSHYSRSSSYHASANNSYNSSYGYRSFGDDRPLSTRLIERDFSCPSLAWDWGFDDPFYYDRLRWRFENDYFKLGRIIPICYRGWNNSSSRNIPVKYISSRRHQICKKSDIDDLTSSFCKRQDENSMSK
jgi:hypothetical protein